MQGRFIAASSMRADGFPLYEWWITDARTGAGIGIFTMPVINAPIEEWRLWTMVMNAKKDRFIGWTTTRIGEPYGRKDALEPPRFWPAAEVPVPKQFTDGKGESHN